MTTRRIGSATTYQFLKSCLPSFMLLGLQLALIGCSGGSGNSGGGTNPQAPGPIVTGVSPATIAAGSAAATLTVTGSNFQQQAVVNWSGTALATTYQSASSLSAAVPANLTAAGSLANITVTNPDKQVSTGGSASQQVSVTNPAPSLSAVAPQSVYAGSADTTFTFTGTNFNSSSVVMVAATPLTTAYISATQVTAVAPAALLAAVGTLSFTVSNPAPGGGASQTIPVSLLQPPATLVSLSPASAAAGSPAVTVTLTGSYFTPTAVVCINGCSAPLPIKFVSSTSIQFTIPAADLTNVGSLSVAVSDPASQNTPSNALAFQIVNPVPVLTSISPGTVTAGAPNFVLTLTGRNFLETSTAQVNGASVQFNEIPTATGASILIPASAISTVGTVSITISNPAPGGGTSASKTLNVISANNRVRTVNVQAADLGWDSAHSLIIASTLSTSATNPTSIVAIDPEQGKVTTSQSLPSAPAGISVTDDGSYVYVTLPSTGQIERLILPSLKPDITINLGSDSKGNLYSTRAVAAAPSQPRTVAISRHSAASYGEAGVVVYDDAVARANIAVPTGYYGSYDTLTWGSDATTLYGTNDVVSSADEDTFSVTSAGVTLLKDQPGVLGEFASYLAYDTKTSRLLDGGGNIVNASSGLYAGQLQVQNSLSEEENPFALDTAQRKVFFLNTQYFNPAESNPGGTYIQAFNFDQFNYINSMLVDGLTGGSTIVRWGTSGLAVNGVSQVYLIDGSFVAPLGVSSAVGTYVAPSPTLTSVNPTAATVGSADLKVTLTGRDFTQASQVSWNNQNLPVDSVTDTQVIVTIPASLLSQAVASPLTVSNGPGTGSSNGLGFTVLPNLGASAQIDVIDISGQDLAWDNTHGLLYVAVPSKDPILPNSIAIVDPAKLAIQQAIPIADQPSAISLSDDAHYLYAGFYGQAIVQRYTLPSFALDLTIPTGAGFASDVVGTRGSCTFAVDVKAAPGSPQSIAVSQGSVNVSPLGCGGVAIYDNALPRPDTLTIESRDFSTLDWGQDATSLFAQSDAEDEPQTLYGIAVSPSGPALSGTGNGGYYGPRVHFDSGTKLLYSDSGVISNPASLTQVGKFSASGLVAVDSTLNRAYVLTTSISSNSGLDAGPVTLSIFNLKTQALISSVVIPDVLGGPRRLVRWGSNGIAFVTTGTSGALYILSGSSVTGTP